MSVFVSDTFTDTAGTLLESHAGETGATWTKAADATGTGHSLAITATGRLRANSGSFARGSYIASGTPATATYYAEADLIFLSDLNVVDCFLLVHIDGSGFGYHAGWRAGTTGWEIGSFDAAGNAITGGTASGTGYVIGNTYRIRLVASVSGSVTTLSLYDVTGGGNTLLCSGTDTNFPSAGHAGVTIGSLSTDDDTHGIQVDNFVAGDWPLGPDPGTTATSSVTSTTLTVSESGASGSGTLNYQFKRSTSSGGSYTNVGTNSTATSQGDTGLSPGTTYWYKCTVTDSNGSVDSTPVSVTTPAGAATAYTLTAPSPASGPAGVASGNFTVTPNGTFTGTITPSDGGSGGTFTPTSLTWSADSSAKAFTYTPGGAPYGAKTISTTNSGSLTDPSSVTYTSLDLINVCWFGDSTMGTTFRDAVMVHLRDDAFYLGGTVAQSGYKIEDLETLSPTIDSYFNPHVSTNIVVYQAATNNLIEPQTPAVAFGHLQSSVALRRSAGWQRVVVNTLCAADVITGTNTGTVGWSAGQYNPLRNAYNALVRGGWRSFADAHADAGASQLLGKDGDEADTTYFVDKIHRTTAGGGGVYEEAYYFVAAILDAAYPGGVAPGGGTAVFNPIGCGFIKGI